MNIGRSVTLAKELLLGKCCRNVYKVTYFYIINQFREPFEATYEYLTTQQSGSSQGWKVVMKRRESVSVNSYV